MPFDFDSSSLVCSLIVLDMRLWGTNIAGVDRLGIWRLIVLLHLAEEDLLEICHFGLWNLSHRRFDVAVISLGVDFLHGLNLGDLLLSGSRFGRFAVAAAHKDKRRGNCDEQFALHWHSP